MNVNSIEIKPENAEQICKAVEKFVWKMARRYATYHDPMDLFQAGMIGVIRAISAFDPERGTFMACARQFVFAEMTSEVQRFQSILYFNGRDGRELSRSFRKTYKTLFDKLHREPNLQEIAEELDVKVSSVTAFALALRGAVPMEPEDDDGEEMAFWQIASGAPSPEVLTERKEILDIVYAVLDEYRRLARRQGSVALRLAARHYFDEISFGDIAAMNRSKQKVTRQAIHRFHGIITETIRKRLLQIDIAV